MLPPGVVDMTERGLALLHLLPRKDLATRLHVWEHPMNSHLTSIRRKLGVTKRDEIVCTMSELKILEP